MKQIRFIAIIAAAAALSVACAKEIDSPELGEGKKLTITASFAEEQTKTTLQDGGTAVYWEVGDEVKLFYDGTGSRFTSACTEPARTSKFTGTMNVMFGFDEGFSDSTPLWGLYPYRADATADNASVTTTLPAEQTGKAGSFAKGMNLSLAKSTSLAMGFYNVCGGVRFSVTRDDVQNVVFEALNGESVAGKVKLAFEEGVPAVQEVVEGATSITLTAPSGGTFEEGKWYYIVALPGTLSGGFKMTFNTDTKYALLKSTDSRTISRSKFGSLADADDGLIYKDKVTPEPGGDDYVDLGLSVKWATCNIGASQPQEYGTYFAWGDVTGQIWNGSSWSGGGFSSYPSYQLDANNNLKPEYDAAHVNLGGMWRMPTKTEYQELIDNCTSTWTSNYNSTGVAGRILTSNKEGYTDKSIFLPAAGSGYYSGLYGAGSYGYYWSSTFDSDYHAWRLFFYSDGVSTFINSRDYGQSVRPVYDESIRVTGVSLNQSSISIDKGSTYSLTATITPANATNKSVTWSSSDESVASVSSDGVVTAIAAGSATITVTAVDGGKTASCTVTVNDPEVVVDLSAKGTANCYIVDAAGSYKFNGTVKGGSTESVGTPASAEVLWESFGTDVTPSVGDVVKNVSLDTGYVMFSTPATLNNGNAVIAVKDASGNILWSWHIWVCKDFDPDASAQVYNNNAGTMMDRNLGATSATPGDVHALGLLYQWGRKDPFLSGCQISYSSSSNQQQAASTISWPGTVKSSSSTGSNAYAVAHPTTFITYNKSNYDWYYTGSSSTDNTRWQTSDEDKGMYDPCPAGWRVPDGDSNGVWSTAFGYSSYWNTASNCDSTNRGMDFGTTDKTLGSGTIWYPAAGYRDSDGGSLYFVGYGGHYWSCTPNGDYACYLSFSGTGGVNPSNSNIYRALGQSVRCLSE